MQFNDLDVMLEQFPALFRRGCVNQLTNVFPIPDETPCLVSDLLNRGLLL
ncbi:hypothetical protein [Aporhodopirellula aestuarii]|uniref:Uncharacterized protein n=1 Tax=Aporhodopirellula aestuarii TaxID=2950107 RepID=A0ABT0U5D5_9BACT|nr:hypothetical protein [Aporhodopirellula aestuarii]MCM2372075.1 hypothetical protein [Aporhodopirellula aestuarii]